eukprot:CAMPEP_0174738262 /NCGR_PEP_ID=MMETSP1094-20130205/69638_1 /TAXON_ID=156173 /ORGANISM="Chrysochromulina brevifilum, Strain UTEX LB 985" /LENGTH=388 /DNA_ID=CAMNT_0015941631 /DNA_START=76 /DNA_END=1239 /DNA_ORIENTATION=+
MSETQQFLPGALVFVPSEQNGWDAMKVIDSKGFGANAVVNAAPLSVPSAARTLDKEEIVQVQESDPLALEGAPDMVKFSKLSEATLLHNLRVRYARDDIYTRSGSILLSINPFKQLSIYTPQHMAQCKDADAKQLQDLAPHVYALAEAAYRGMLIEQKKQAILISGESGAGKTEAVKACLRHVVSRSRDAARELAGGSSLAERAGFVEDCIMQANPLLEALGNAKTVRNGNSSRFGKWVEIQFDASGFITASRATSYLLEKSRVTERGKGERTYHVLYQLCRGCSAEERAQLHLLPPAEFRFIGESAAIQVPTVDDVQWWAATCHAMDVFGITKDELSGVRAVLASVLHLGNLDFATVQMAQQDDGSKVEGPSTAQLQAAAELLGLAP